MNLVCPACASTNRVPEERLSDQPVGRDVVGGPASLATDAACEPTLIARPGMTRAGPPQAGDAPWGADAAGGLGAGTDRPPETANGPRGAVWAVEARARVELAWADLQSAA